MHQALGSSASLSVLQLGLAPWPIDDARPLFRNACFCSQWAKRVDRRTRECLYGLKDQIIAELRGRYKDQIDERGDCDRHRGLFSIALRSDPRRRLHTHENWLPAA